MGYIHSLESFGSVDGPGVRFVVFFQGCPMRCAYCHNPDTWDLSDGKEMSADEILQKMLRNRAFYTRGGITATGGEPMMQMDFLIELFTKAKAEGIHTCIDTSGMVSITDEIKELLDLTDLVLLDIKHIDEEKCKELVGFSNKKELEFARYLSDNNIPIWIRQVIIPGITDDKEDLEKLKQFIDSLNNVQKVELLPYHSLGKYKWDKLGKEYELGNIKDATEENIKRAKEIMEL